MIYGPNSSWQQFLEAKRFPCWIHLVPGAYSHHRVPKSVRSPRIRSHQVVHTVFQQETDSPCPLQRSYELPEAITADSLQTDPQGEGQVRWKKSQPRPAADLPKEKMKTAFSPSPLSLVEERNKLNWATEVFLSLEDHRAREGTCCTIWKIRLSEMLKPQDLFTTGSTYISRLESSFSTTLIKITHQNITQN